MPCFKGKCPNVNVCRKYGTCIEEAKNVCMCGDDVNHSPIAPGSPVSMYDYYTQGKWVPFGLPPTFLEEEEQ